MMTARCVVFDVDDTLYPEREYVRSGFVAVGQWAKEALGIDDFFERAWHVFELGVRGTIFDEVLTSAGRRADPVVVREMVERYRTHRPAIALSEDARRALAQLRGSATLAALTDGPVQSQMAKIAALELEQYLDPIVCTEALGVSFRKPSPLGFERIQLKTGAPPASCVYVADNPLKDFHGPKRLGWQTVRIRRPEGLHRARPSGNDVDVELPSLDGLVDLLEVR